MKASSLIIAALLFSSLNAATEADNTQVVPSQQRDSFYSQTDDEYLTKQIRNALGGYQHVNIRLMNGKILLTGYVDSEEDRQRIKEAIGKVDQVLAVEDKLTVRKDQANPTTDADLQRTIEQDLKKNLSNATKNVRIRVLNRVVIITGQVDNSSLRQEIKDRIRKIAGVTSIDDQIEVKDRDPKTVKKINEYYLKQRRLAQAEAFGPAFEDDRRTLERVRDLLSSEQMFNNVSADSYDGKIWLSGIVRNQSEKETLESRVRQLEGVHQVDTSGLRIAGKSYLK